MDGTGSRMIGQMSRMNRYRWLLPLAAALLLVLALHSLAVACPTCKDSIDQSDPQRQNLVQGYFYSIMFMVSMPFVILGSLCGYFYYEVCKARRLQQTKPVASGMRQLPAS